MSSDWFKEFVDYDSENVWRQLDAVFLAQDNYLHQKFPTIWASEYWHDWRYARDWVKVKYEHELSGDEFTVQYNPGGTPWGPKQFKAYTSDFSITDDDLGTYFVTAIYTNKYDRYYPNSRSQEEGFVVDLTIDLNSGYGSYFDGTYLSTDIPASNGRKLTYYVLNASNTSAFNRFELTGIDHAAASQTTGVLENFSPFQKVEVTFDLDRINPTDVINFDIYGSDPSIDNSLWSKSVVAKDFLNYAPRFQSESKTLNVDEDSALEYYFEAGDDNGTEIAFRSTSAIPDWLTFDAASGIISGTPTNNEVGFHTLSIRATDPLGAYAEQSITINVHNTNDLPTVSSPTQIATNEDASTVPVVFSANDIDGDILTYSFGTPNNGSVIDNGNGTFTYTPNTNFNGTDSFTLTVNDGTADVTEIINVTVSAVNDSPAIFSKSSIELLEDTSATQVQFSASDIDGDILTYSFGTPNNGSVIDNGNGTFTYTPNTNFNGTDSFTLTVNDGTADVTKTIDLIVNPVNDAPSLPTSFEVKTTEDSNSQQIVLPSTDVDGDHLTYTYGNPTNGELIKITDGTFTYAPKKNFNGTDSFILTISDGFVSTFETVNVIVDAVNDAPIIFTNDFIATNKNEVSEPIKFSATDIDGDTLTYTLSAASGNVVNNGNGTFTYTPETDHIGWSTIYLTVNDGTLDVTKRINVKLNDKPKLSTTTSIITNEDTNSVPIEFSATDLNHDTLTYQFSNATNGTVINNGNGTFTYTPNTNFNGSDSFIITVNDGTVDVEETISVTVNAVNDAPTLTTTTSLSTNEDTTSTAIPFSATDIDNDTLNFSFSKPAHGIVTDNNGTFSYKPNSNYNGSDSFTLTVNDGIAGVTETINITVNAVNDDPIIESTAVTSATQGTPYTYTFTASDIDGDTLTLSSPTLPTWLHFDPISGILSGIPDRNAVGDNSVVLRVLDPSGAYKDQIFSISVEEKRSIEGTSGNDTLTGSSYDDVINAYAGDDTLRGEAGNDTLYGGAGDDQLYGGDGNDIIKPGDGADIVDAGAGNDIVYASHGIDQEDGGDGVDTYVVEHNLDYVPMLDLELETAYLLGGEPGTLKSLRNFENVTILSNGSFGIKGDANANVLTADKGNDILIGGAGNDTLNGGAGNDNLNGGRSDVISFDQNNTYGTGVEDWTRILPSSDVLDLFAYLELSTPVLSYDLYSNNAGDFTGFADEGGSHRFFLRDEVAQWDAHTQIGYTIWTSGTGSQNNYHGWVYESDHHSRVGYYDELDLKHKAYSFENISISEFSALQQQAIEAIGLGSNPFYNFADVASVSIGRRNLSTESETSKFDLHVIEHLDANGGRLGGLIFELEHGIFEKFGSGDNIYKIWGGGSLSNATEVTDLGTVKSNWMSVQSSVIEMIIGNDYIPVDNNDTINGGDGHDLLYGSFGDDTLNGGAGDETLVYDGRGDDTITAGAGEDTLKITLPGHLGWSEYRDGNDLVITSSNGTDTARVKNAYTTNDRLEYIEYSLGWDGVVLREVSETSFVPTSGNHFFAGTSGNDTIDGGNALSISATGYLGDDTISGSAGADFIGGNSGNDTIYGLDGDDVLLGGSGDDTLDAGSGDDQLYGGSGNDTLVHSGSGAQLFDGGEGNDTYKKSAVQSGLNLNIEVNLETGYTGSVTDRNHSLRDTIANIENVDFGLVDWDLVLIGDYSVNILTAGSGDDKLFGGAGDDTLVASTGDDFISGGLGADVISTGPGSDIIVYEAAGDVGDTINDFSAANDIIAVSQLITQLSAIPVSYSDLIRLDASGSDTIVKMSPNGDGNFSLNVATLKNIAPSALTASNFDIEGATLARTLSGNITSSRQSEAFDGDPTSYPNADVYAFATGNDEDLFLRAISLGDVTSYEVVATPDADIQSFGLELASTSGLDISEFTVDATTLSTLGGVILPNVISANEVSVAAISTSGSLTGNQEHVLATFKTTGVGTLSITNGQIGTDGIPTLSYDIKKVTTGGTGNYNMTFDNGDAVQLQAQADYVVPSTNPITPSDALEVLKTVVRINQSPTPEQLIAGDVDMDGKLTPSDALSILKKVVRMDGGVEPEWIFIDGDKDYSSLSFTNVDYDNMIDIASIAADTTINFEGILLGDFDGTL